MPTLRPLTPLTLMACKYWTSQSEWNSHFGPELLDLYFFFSALPGLITVVVMQVKF